jgi:cobalt-zinc-cadmium efflux system outer membrane protein
VRRFVLYCLLPVTLMSPLGLAQSGPANDRPTLEQLIGEALARNLRLLAERYNLPIAEARVLQARLRPNPTLLLQWQYVDTFGIGFSAERNPAGPPEVDIGVLLPIVRGQKRKYRIETAQSARAGAEADFLNTSRTLILDVENAFVDLLVAEDQMQLNQASEADFKRLVELDEQRVRAGDLAKVELMRSRVALLQFQNQVLRYGQSFRAAKFRLQALVGRTEFRTQFMPQGELRREATVESLEVLTAKALEFRPDLVSARREIDRARANLKLQNAIAKPDWAVYAWVNRQYNIGIQNGTSMTFQWNAPLPVSDRNQGEIARAQQELAQAQARLRALEQDIRSELTVAYSQYLSTVELIAKIEKELLNPARDVLETIRYSYQRGEASLVSLLDAQRAYNETIFTTNEALGEHARALYLIDALVGKTRP